MAIPATTSHDLFLRTLLEIQVDDFDRFVDVKEVVSGLPVVDRHLSDQGFDLPHGMWRDIDFLERHYLVEVRRDNPHVRLTPLGIHLALSLDPVSVGQKREVPSASL